MNTEGDAHRGVAVFAIPNAHIDPVWIWDWREGMREVVATFQAAADRLDENEDLFFVASSAAYYAWVEEIDPALFSRIQAHVESGRWELVGGEWIEPDCNIPAGESVCRQLLYSQRYFQRAFGRTASVAYNIDSFGHAGSLPQLFVKAGLDRYVMMRPQEHEHSIPASLFLWHGIDGTPVLTYRIHEAYQTGLSLKVTEPLERIEQELIERRSQDLAERSRTALAPEMFFVGVGDHGGGPTKSAIRQIRQMACDNNGAITFSTPRRYFDEVSRDASVLKRLPSVEGDLHMHAVGCYSAVSWIKEENAVAERMLVTAEKMAALCAIATGVDINSHDALRAAWLRVLFNQFHDSLGGTCTEEAFEDLRQFYGYARTVADEITMKATQLIAARVDTWIEGTKDLDRLQSLNPFVAHFPVPVVVFNPFSWPVRTPIVMPHPAAAVTVEGGEQVAVQNVASREGTRYEHHALVVTELPPLGYRVYWLHREGQPGCIPAVARCAVAGAEGLLENDLLSVRVSPEGRITSILSKSTQREWLLAEGIRFVVLDDPSDTWSHGVVGYDGAEQECELVELRQVEEGPLRATVRLTYRWQDSLIYADVVLWAELDYFDIILRVDWRQRQQLLKLVVPMDIESERLSVGIPYGQVERSAVGQEEVMSHWLDVTEPGSHSGVICSSDSGYSYDARGARVRFTVLRSPRFADHGAAWTSDDVVDQPATDQGWRRVSYRFRPHFGPTMEGPRQAEEHGALFPIVSETWHTGPLGPSHSGMELNSENVVATVLKRAEDDSGWVVRLVETMGQGGATRLKMEQLGLTWVGELRPFEVKTLHLPDGQAEVRELAISELVELSALERAGSR